jgi:transcriptional regulator with XRE-family HTH domain
MSAQGLYTKLDLDNWGGRQYHNGMNILGDLRKGMGQRRGRAVPQHEVAAAIGVEQETVSRYESGKRDVPFERALALAKFYQVKIGLLVPALKLDETESIDALLVDVSPELRAKAYHAVIQTIIQSGQASQDDAAE